MHILYISRILYISKLALLLLEIEQIKHDFESYVYYLKLENESAMTIAI